MKITDSTTILDKFREYW